MNKKIIYLSIAATLAMPQLLKAQNVGIGTTTPTTTLEVSSQKKLGLKSATDSAMGPTTVNTEFINFPAGIKGEFKALGANDGSGVLGIATAPNQYYGTGVTGVGNWIGVLGIGNPDADAAIVAEANGATYGLKVIGNSLFNNNINISGEAVIGNDALVGGVLYVEDVYASYDIQASGDVTVGGTITIEGGTPGVGKVLTSTGTSGAATWQTPATVAPIGFAASKNDGDITIPQAATWTKIPFGSISYAQGGAYNTTNSEFTVPAGGFYHFDVKLSLDNFTGTASNTESMTIAIYRRSASNPTGLGIYTYRFMPKISASTTEGFSTTIPLSANDIIDIRVFNLTNGTIVLKGPNTSGMNTYFAGYRVY